MASQGATKPADRCARRQFNRLPTAVTTSQRDSRRSLSSELGTKAVSLFSESGREECSSGRNDAPGLRVLGAKLRLHQVFWSQNLAFQSQNATMRPDFSSPELLPGQTIRQVLRNSHAAYKHVSTFKRSLQTIQPSLESRFNTWKKAISNISAGH